MKEEDMIMPFHVWHNAMMRDRTRPSGRCALFMLLLGRRGAEEMWQRYLDDMAAWRERWYPKEKKA